MLPASAREHYGKLQRLQATLLIAVRQQWARMRPVGDWSAQYDKIAQQILTLVAAAQSAAASESDDYAAKVLAELGIVKAASPGVVNPFGFVGLAGDGRPVNTLLPLAVVKAGEAFNRQRDEFADALFPDAVKPSPEQALAQAGRWLTMATQTIVADTARAAESAVMATHPEVVGYVRMLNPPSCARCVVLAGKFYRWNTGFERHPRCDCIHIPARESDHRDLTVNPNSYFDSLDRKDQDKTFTAAGAQAIRDGADLGQVVNARRGMRTAQLYGRDVQITLEGTTRHGYYGGGHGSSKPGIFQASAEELATRLTATGPQLRRVHRRRATRARLMPESIYRFARDRDDAIRLLKLYGFIL